MHNFDQVVANMQLQEPGLRELASGVDALYLSGRAELPKRFLARLEDCRAWAVEAKRPAPCEIGERTFGIAPHGWGKYRFCLDHNMARIGFSTSRHLPTVRIQPRSEFLHAVGPGAAVATLREMLEPELGSCASGSTGSISSPTGRAGCSASTMPTASSAGPRHAAPTRLAAN